MTKKKTAPKKDDQVGSKELALKATIKKLEAKIAALEADPKEEAIRAAMKLDQGEVLDARIRQNKDLVVVFGDGRKMVFAPNVYTK